MNSAATQDEEGEYDEGKDEEHNSVSGPGLRSKIRRLSPCSAKIVGAIVAIGVSLMLTRKIVSIVIMAASILLLGATLARSQADILTEDSPPSPTTTVIGKLPFKVDSATVVRLSRGPNWVDLLGSGRKEDLIVSAYRDNGNAHSFSVFAIYVQGWQLVPRFDMRKDKIWESPMIAQTFQGADCVLDDMRIVQLKGKEYTQVFLILGSRARGQSFVDSESVSFDVYRLWRNPEGITGQPPFYFEYEVTVPGKGKYCDINKAFKAELGLAPYNDFQLADR